MGITYGDHLIDSGYYDITPEQEREIEDAMNIENGKTYVDRWGDVHGPMDERAPGCFLDQHGAVYQPDGRQWNHLDESMSTLVEASSASNGTRETPA